MDKSQYLIRFEACEAEHPNLVDDMLPVVAGAVLLQTSHQLLSHLNDTVSHAMDLLQPGMNEHR